MARTQLVGRILKAAEAWGRQQYRQEVTAAGYTEPERDAGGRLTSVVDLEGSEGGKLGQVQCSVIMEPDGTIRCLSHRSEAG